MTKRLFCLLLTTATLPATADDKKPAAGTPLAKAYKEWRDLSWESMAIKKKVAENSALQKLNAAQRAAYAALNKKIAEVSTAENAAVKAAQDALDTEVDKQIAVDKGISAAQKEYDALAEKKRAANFEIALAQTHLYNRYSVVQTALDADKELQALRKATYGRTKEAKAAWTKYNETRKAKLAALRAARPHLARIAALELDLKKMSADSYKLYSKIRDLKRKMRYSDAGKLKSLRENLDKAYQARRKASTQKSTQTVRKAYDDARNAYREKQRELYDAAPGAKALQAKIAEVNKRIYELRKKAKPKKDTRKKSKPKKK